MTNDQLNWLETFERATNIPTGRVADDSGKPLTEFDAVAEQLLKTYMKQIIEVQSVLNIARANYKKFSDKLPRSKPLKPLTFKQAAALRLVNAWTASMMPYYRLCGYAGTGKTFLLQHFAQTMSSSVVIFTSPTNKATKVLRKLLPDYKCKTIYSVLGLKMVQREDELVLTPSDEKVDLSGVKIIVVDEASMLNSELVKYIDESRKRWGVKFLFVGDPAQLPPVGEDRSPVWEIECQQSLLTEVVRHDNQILTLATHIRDHIESGTRLTPIELNEGKRCVWQLSRNGFVERLRKHAKKGFVNSRAVAWRNRTVDHLNEIIRQELFTNEQLSFGRWIVGDRIVITEPMEEFGKIVATVDEEGVVVSSVVADDHITGMTCYHLQVEMEDGRTLHIRPIHENSEQEFQRTLGQLAHEARQPGQGKVWRKFWGLKYRFHCIRHAFAITAHRAQGSTFMVTFVDASDILKNPDRDTAYRCLYVSSSRPSHKLFITGLP